MKDNKLFIFTCVYNGKEFINKLFDSMLSQTSNNFIHYIYDDGSKDDISNLVNSYKEKAYKLSKPFQVIYEKSLINKGSLFATKHCLDKMIEFKECNYFGWVNADDWVSNDYIETFLINIKKHKKYDLYMGQYDSVSFINDKMITNKHSFNFNKESNRNGKVFSNYMQHYFVYGCFVASIDFYKNNMKTKIILNPKYPYYFNDEQIFFGYSFSDAKFYHIKNKTIYYFWSRKEGLSQVSKLPNYAFDVLKTFESAMINEHSIDLIDYANHNYVYYKIRALKEKMSKKEIITLLNNYFKYKLTHRKIKCRLFEKSKIIYALIFTKKFKQKMLLAK